MSTATASRSAARSSSSSSTEDRPLVDHGIVKLHIASGFFYFIVAIFAGLIYALQLDGIYPFPGVELLSPGRVRMLHTNAVAYGFLFNLFIAALNWIVPRLTGRPVLSPVLSKAIWVAWQVIVLSAALGILGGQAQAICLLYTSPSPRDS